MDKVSPTLIGATRRFTFDIHWTGNDGSSNQEELYGDKGTLLRHIVSLEEHGAHCITAYKKSATDPDDDILVYCDGHVQQEWRES